MIGVFGGSFDPIHYGHLRPAIDVVNALELTKCLIIPCKTPHHRGSPISTIKNRIAMLTVAIKSEKKLFIDLREINRDGVSYSFDTLNAIKNDLPEIENETICLILGMDAFVNFDKWYRWRDILEISHIVITYRPGWDIEKILESKTVSNELKDVILRQRVLNKITLSEKNNGGILFQQVTQLDISSTKIRNLLENNKSIRYLLPDEVITIITKENIYKRND